MTPWYGENIPGGAEAELRGLVTNLTARGVELEVLTTCVEKFTADWNKDFYKPGAGMVGTVPVRRFRVRKRDTAAFDAVNYKLMHDRKVTPEEEEIYIREMVNSPELYEYMKAHKDEYRLFVFIPYMFGTTYYGIQSCPEKSVMIPCFHDEAYIYLDIFREMFQKLRGVIYLAEPEMKLANKVFHFENTEQAALGAGVDSGFEFQADRFRTKYHIKEPFILYAGRKDAGKNIHALLRYFEVYKSRHVESTMKLVLIGGGSVDVPKSVKADVVDLGFVDRQDKYDAYSAATVMCQPSFHESFSIVIMESWLCERPVLVHEKCEVTKDFAKKTNGGLYFSDYWTFEGCIEYFEQHPETAGEMGRNGKRFVEENFTWDVICERYMDFFTQLSGE